MPLHVDDEIGIGDKTGWAEHGTDEQFNKRSDGPNW